LGHVQTRLNGVSGFRIDRKMLSFREDKHVAWTFGLISYDDLVGFGFSAVGHESHAMAVPER
jgi:hypothetical protein